MQTVFCLTHRTCRGLLSHLLTHSCNNLLDEKSVFRKGLEMQNINNTQTFTPSAGFETAFPASERMQTDARPPDRLTQCYGPLTALPYLTTDSHSSLSNAFFHHLLNFISVTSFSISPIHFILGLHHLLLPYGFTPKY